MNSTTDTSSSGGPGGPDILTERLARDPACNVFGLIEQGANPNGWVWVDEGLQNTPLAMAIARQDNQSALSMLTVLSRSPDPEIPMHRRRSVGDDESWEESTLFDALVANLMTGEVFETNSGPIFDNIKVFLMNSPVPEEWRIGIGQALLRSITGKPLDISGFRADNLAYLLPVASFEDANDWNTVVNGTKDAGEFMDHAFNEVLLRETLGKIVDSAVADGLHVDAISGHYFHLDDYYPMTLLQMAVLHDDVDLVTHFLKLGADPTVRFPEEGGKTRDEWRGADLVSLARLAERNTVLPMLEAIKAREIIMNTVAAAAKRLP